MVKAAAAARVTAMLGWLGVSMDVSVALRPVVTQGTGKTTDFFFVIQSCDNDRMMLQLYCQRQGFFLPIVGRDIPHKITRRLGSLFLLPRPFCSDFAETNLVSFVAGLACYSFALVNTRDIGFLVGVEKSLVVLEQP